MKIKIFAQTSLGARALMIVVLEPSHELSLECGEACAWRQR